MTLRWIDVLTLGRASSPRQGRTPSSRQMVVRTLALSGLLEQKAPSYLAVALIGRPWSPDPAAHVPIAALASLAAFDEPEWLKYGIEWTLAAPSSGATALVTRTLCAPTDAQAWRRFRAYWLPVRPLGGLLRLAMLAAIRRHAELHHPPIQSNGTDP